MILVEWKGHESLMRWVLQRVGMSVDISFGEFSYKGEQRSKTEPREGCGVKEGFFVLFVS